MTNLHYSLNVASSARSSVARSSVFEVNKTWKCCKFYLFGAAAISVALTVPAIAQNDDPRRAATQATQEVNAELLGYLPFDDTVDFDNAHKGWIAPLPSDVIRAEGRGSDLGSR